MEVGFVALGLVQGALAGLNATGFVLLWRTTRVVNLAQPSMGLVGGVLTGMLVSSAGWSFWWAAPLGIALSAAIAFAAERLVLARLADLPRAVPMVATIGLAQLFTALQSGIPFAFGGRLPSYDVRIGVEWFLFPVLLKGGHLLALLALPIAVVGVHRFVHRSRRGRRRACRRPGPSAAQALGVDTGFVRSVAWTVAGTLSGVAGVLSIPVLGFSLGDGVAPTVLLLALAPAVLAGLRNLGGALAASLAVGVAYQFAPAAHARRRHGRRTARTRHRRWTRRATEADGTGIGARASLVLVRRHDAAPGRPDRPRAPALDHGGPARRRGHRRGRRPSSRVALALG